MLGNSLDSCLFAFVELFMNTLTAKHLKHKSEIMSTKQNQQKRVRTVAKSRFTRYKNVLQKNITDDEKNLELINEFYNDFLNAWKNVEEQHNKYVSIVGEVLDENLNEQWINEIQNSSAET